MRGNPGGNFFGSTTERPPLSLLLVAALRLTQDVLQVGDIFERQPYEPAVRAGKRFGWYYWGVIKNELMPFDVIRPKGRG
jgi:hypothetical protein